MFSWILKIMPKLDESTLKAMERSLSSRFMRVAKGFGKGLLNVLKGGGILGAGLALIDKLLNPLKEVQEAIDRTLKSSDDIATNARQFETTSGKLLKVITLAKGAGLDQDNLFLLISKYQTAVAEAKQDPNKPSAVRNFVGQADTLEGFFEFLQSLGRMEKNQQILVQQQVFGEKQILKMADFLQTVGDPKALTQLVKQTGFGNFTSDKLTKAVGQLSDLNDLTDALTAGRDLKDVIAKSRVINEGVIRSRDASEKIALQRENQRIANYQNLANLSQTVEKISGLIDKGVGLIGSFIPKVTSFFDDIIIKIDQILKSPFMRGIFGKRDK